MDIIEKVVTKSLHRNVTIGVFEKRFTTGEFVSGYTISQLEKSLIGQRTFNDWKNKIKNDYENSTENNLDNVFNYWDTAQ